MSARPSPGRAAILAVQISTSLSNSAVFLRLIRWSGPARGLSLAAARLPAETRETTIATSAQRRSASVQNQSTQGSATKSRCRRRDVAATCDSAEPTPWKLQRNVQPARAEVHTHAVSLTRSRDVRFDHVRRRGRGCAFAQLRARPTTKRMPIFVRGRQQMHLARAMQHRDSQSTCDTAF